MDSKINLAEMEKKTYLTYHGDGLWDIFAGLFLMSIGFFMFYDTPYLMGIIPATMLPVVLGAKKSFVQPRMGYVKFSPKRQARVKQGHQRLSLLLAFTTVAGLGVFFAFTGDAEWQKSIQDLGLLPFGFVLAAVSIACGMLFGFKRFIVYGGLIILIFISGHLANSDPPAYFILIGFIIFVVGVVMLIRFVRRFPKNKEEMPYVN